MKVQTQTNPQTPNQLNKVQTQTNPQNLQQLIEEVLKKYLQQPQPQNSQPQNNLSTDEFVVKSNMKASIIALKIESMLLQRKKVILSGIGYAVPPLLDSIMLIRKDLKGININIALELFEKEVVDTKGKKRIITGLRAILTI